jgi:hypothetical protein
LAESAHASTGADRVGMMVSRMQTFSAAASSANGHPGTSECELGRETRQAPVLHMMEAL